MERKTYNNFQLIHVTSKYDNNDVHHRGVRPAMEEGNGVSNIVPDLEVLSAIRATRFGLSC